MQMWTGIFANRKMHQSVCILKKNAEIPQVVYQSEFLIDFDMLMNVIKKIKEEFVCMMQIKGIKRLFEDF